MLIRTTFHWLRTKPTVSFFYIALTTQLPFVTDLCLPWSLMSQPQTTLALSRQLKLLMTSLSPVRFPKCHKLSSAIKIMFVDTHRLVTCVQFCNATVYGTSMLKKTVVDSWNSTNCIAAAKPSCKRSVSVFGINRQFIDVIFTDHFWLHELCLFHTMDHYSRYSVSQPVLTANLFEAVVASENLRIAQSWPPKSVHGIIALLFDSFVKYLASYYAERLAVPPRHRHKNSKCPSMIL